MGGGWQHLASLSGIAFWVNARLGKRLLAFGLYVEYQSLGRSGRLTFDMEYGLTLADLKMRGLPSLRDVRAGSFARGVQRFLADEL
jgi:hypothetical protein